MGQCLSSTFNVVSKAVVPTNKDGESGGGLDSIVEKVQSLIQNDQIQQIIAQIPQFLNGGEGESLQDRVMRFLSPIKEIFTGPTEYDQAIGEDDWVPPTKLPAQHVETDAEKLEQKKRWATFATFMAKPYNYDSKYKQQLQELDAMGCINLERTSRDQIPSLEINYCCALFFCPYEGLPHTLDLGPINDGINMAKLFVSRRYRVFYFCDATPQDYYRWMDWLLDNVEVQFCSYFSGHGTQIPDKTGKEKDGLSEVMVFYDEDTKFKKTGGQKVTAVAGITNETITDTVMHELIMNKEYPQTRIVLITDCCHSGTMFNFDQPLTNLKPNIPPPNVVCIGAAQDEETAKQTVLGGKESGVFTYNFEQLIKSKPATNFNELQTYMKKNIAKYQNIQITASKQELLGKAVVMDMELIDSELQLADLPDILNQKAPEKITSVPVVDVPSKVEVQEAKKRWSQFISELQAPAPYVSKYKDQLQKLDSLGCINLERIKREQIPPNIDLSYCIALFFCPYEDLPHTLDVGPVNDALLMSQLFLNRGYNVVYLCDATPHEYYKWMDWLLSNVQKEFVSFFSGHGTQMTDKTGLETDGLTEVIVLYNAKSKKNQSVTKITPIKGITDETVEDTVMHDLIISKDYPDTRVVLLTDCCHSGTMFNFDQPISPNAKLNSPQSQTIKIVCVGAAVDAQTAKQTVQGNIESGVFTYNFTQLVKSKPATTFNELNTYMVKNVAKYQTIQLTGTSSSLYSQPVVVNAK
ncbi:MAG: hypothetical protein EZS28_007774 [Streblomastix strix]|uniref:Peptidase C14 caspase domain-containing protein n=1 Tax=Streblomastix strix TaxID=222440 RepID=A0A5J4WQK1_9EUKA|nr:MAG: hypothetical protein EZS28_007774 [Streblomastix strix]